MLVNILMEKGTLDHSDLGLVLEGSQRGPWGRPEVLKKTPFSLILSCFGNFFQAFLPTGSTDLNNDEMKQAPARLSREPTLGGLKRALSGPK